MIIVTIIIIFITAVQSGACGGGGSVDIDVNAEVNAAQSLVPICSDLTVHLWSGSNPSWMSSKQNIMPKMCLCHIYNISHFFYIQV